MTNYYWNDWYPGWGWVLWYGFVLLLVSSAGNWGYSYRVHRKYQNKDPHKNALSILNERYARGEIKQEEYIRMKTEISTPHVEVIRKSA